MKRSRGRVDGVKPVRMSVTLYPDDIKTMDERCQMLGLNSYGALIRQLLRQPTEQKPQPVVLPLDVPPLHSLHIHLTADETLVLLATLAAQAKKI